MHKTKMKKQTPTSLGFSGVPLVIAIGVVVASVTFLIAFITTQKAAAPYTHRGLKLVIPTVPPNPSLPAAARTPFTPPLPYSVSELDDTQTLEKELQESELTDPTSEVDRLDTDINSL